MEASLKIFLLISVAVYFAIIISMLRRNKLGLKYTLLWIMCGVIMLLFTIFPDIVFKTSALVGISNPVNAVFMLFAVLSLLLLLSMTSVTSMLSEKNLRLAQNMALIEERLRRLEADSKDK